MRTRSKLLLAALIATAFMSLAINSASARRFETSNQTFRLVWSALRSEIRGSATVECPVTLEGSFHSRTTSKVSGQLIGYITRAFVRGGSAECNNTGTARFNTETLPWHLRYVRFWGTLPNITEVSMQIIGVDSNIDPEGTLPNCRARTEAAHPAVGILIIIVVGALLVERTLRSDETATIPLTGGLCEFSGPGDLAGTAEVFVQGSTSSRINVRLVQ